MSLSVNQIDEYMQALLINARQLLSESEILFKNKAYSRSYTLAHISREEIAKCKILYAAGRRLVSGVEVDWKLTMKRLRDHKSKLSQETISNSILAATVGNDEDFEKILNVSYSLSKKRNDDKNNSLYVGILSNGEISSPEKVINKELAELNILLSHHAIAEESSVQNKLGKLANMDLKKMGDISAIDDMDIVDKKALIKSLAVALASRYSK